MTSNKFPDHLPPTKVTYVGGQPMTIHLRKCKLVIKEGNRWTQEQVFDKNPITFGSAEDNDLRLQDETVSRYHCQIMEEDKSYLLIDKGSTNGTFIDGVRIREAFLKPGCIIGVGKTEMKFLALDEKLEILPSMAESFGGFIGRNSRVRKMYGILEKIAPTGVTVVIEGLTGTGKEVIARAIHDESPRKNGPFMVIDCGGVPPNLIESELFGHEKGSFSGAIMTRQGLFEMANGGTVFLDELGELPLDLQPKLLRVLEQREVRRVGSNRAIPIDVRVIAATNRNLEEEVREGRFRQDLFYRLSVVRVLIPPLKDRRDDIPLLVKHFLKISPFNRDPEGKARVKRVDREAMKILQRNDWPGNARELLNTIERAVSMSEEGLIKPQDLSIEPTGKTLGPPTAEATVDDNLPFKEAKDKLMGAFEREYILSLLTRNKMNISHAAKEAGIDRKYFRKLMHKYNITSSK